ncbi:hypothetical protein HELRODRAFT_166754 [Helobdella robusta]|uniref:Endonuclease/exonuclease/phosphatase domain-containing protein n=1 Tax=Helobdella robusta TaxID=6412 RepID=T1EYG9_HELRO|nr:hypothetical protein HELRODRAFT_166754 [Helobdella robusta]ESO11730.1 hypothetical protein HELRODRAFT_166754 [Helobdella robusta]
MATLEKTDGFDNVHGGFGYGERNEDDNRILEFAESHGFCLLNVYFRKSCNDKGGCNDREVTKKDTELKLQSGPFNSSSADTLLDLFNSEIVRIVDIVAPCRYVKSTHNSNSAKLDSLDRPDSKLSAEISTFKSDLKSSFATVVGQEVKKNIECVNLEVKTVKRKLTESIDIKDRERNIIIFNLQEGEDDKIRVKNILLKLFDDIKDSHIKYVTRLGKKNESSTRPILIVLDSLMSKETVMKNAHKLRVNKSDFILLSIYRPGSVPPSPSFFSELANVLEVLSLLSDKIVVAGDFNVHLDRKDDPNTVSLNEVREVKKWFDPGDA